MKVDIQSEKRIFDDKFKVEEAMLQYERFDGQMSKTVRRLNFERGDSVAAVVFNRDIEKILLINEFRYSTYHKGPGWINEVVAGMRDEHEQPEEAMRREMKEEIGYSAGELTHIATFYVSPGGTSERIMLYYTEVGNADRTSQGGGLASENEDIKLVELSPQQAWQMLDAGEIIDAKTIIGLTWLRNHLAEKSTA